MTEDVRRVPFRKKPMAEKFQIVFFGHPEKRRGDKIVLSKWGFSWGVFWMFALIAVTALLCGLCGCVTLRESDRREHDATCTTWAQAIAVVDRYEGKTVDRILMEMERRKELDCQGGR